VCGQRFSSSAGNISALVIKLDFSGKIMWEKSYSGIGQSTDAMSILQTNTGYVFIGDQNKDSLLVVGTDANGTELWRKKGEGWNGAGGISMTTTTNGYLVAGSQRYCLKLWKLDVNGNIVWEYWAYDLNTKKYANNFEFGNQAHFVSSTSDGGNIVIGNGQTGSHTYDSHLWLIKIR
jgi:hypothetical protein